MMNAKQLAIVWDLNKCMGCQTCTMACKVLWTNFRGMDHMWWMKETTMPGRGSPRDWEKMGGGYDGSGKLSIGRLPTLEEFGEAWEFNHEEVFYGGNQDSFLHPGNPPTWGPNWEEDMGAGDYPNSYFFYMPRQCNNCSHPACVEACPVAGAISKREEDGIVLINEEFCEGARCEQPCSRACPYKVIYRNTKRQVSQMCNSCISRLQKGVAPACVRQCPGRAGHIDFLNGSENSVSQMVKTWKVALPLHPEFNTNPNVFYIPPLNPPRFDPNGRIDNSQPRIPLEYLKSLFGLGVEAALDTLKSEMSRRRNKDKSELMDTLIAHRWTTLLGPFEKDPSEAKGVR